MHILIIAATTFEIAPTVTWLREQARETKANTLLFERCRIEISFTGVGMTATAFALGHRFGSGELPQLAIQAGVGGAIDRTLELGEVVRIQSEVFGDLGAEDAAGNPMTLSDIGLAPGPPFAENGRLLPNTAAHLPFRECRGMSVNRVSGAEITIHRRTGQFPEAEVESMEGAAFFYACMQAGVEPLQLRAISNYVEARNRDAWRMGEAITNLNEALQKVLGPFLT